jgi:hypothetical protein
VNVSYNGSASASTGSGGGGILSWGGKLLAGLITVPLAALVVVFLPILIGLVLLGAVTFGGLLYYFKKLAG